MTLTTEQINNLLDIKESYKASDALMEILFNKKRRESLFLKFLELEKDVSFDWFHAYFQDEHADRKLKKQDFTPNSLSEILSKIIGNVGSTLDVAAGTGGITIKKWWNNMLEIGFEAYKPSLFFYQCEELSDRALPFLLFNLAIRGTNAVVVHGDSLTREVNQIYFIQNDNDDALLFSSINVMPHSTVVESYFDVKGWTEVEINHIESPFPPKYLREVIGIEKE